MKSYDVAIIGAGIVGLATAWAIIQKNPKKQIVILEKEAEPALHQSKNNSGVIHSGLYYKPGSKKAVNCQKGYFKLLEFCKEHSVKFNLCGKVVAAVNEQEFLHLEELRIRGIANGLKNLQYLSPEETKEREPNLQCQKALWVPQTGVIVFRDVVLKLTKLLERKGVIILYNSKVIAWQETSNGIELNTESKACHAKFLINCGGLYADRLAGIQSDIRIVPFRGEYWNIKKERQHLVNHLIYPVPNPNLPFLGVHFTRRINGIVDIGPNAVVAFSREGYRFGQVNLKDIRQMLNYPGFWKMSARFAGVGVNELRRSLSKRLFLKEAQKYIPTLTATDIEPGGTGVRAQAINRKGELVYDFHIVKGKNSIHVLNAPSPAATSCLAIGESIADLVD